MTIVLQDEEWQEIMMEVNHDSPLGSCISEYLEANNYQFRQDDESMITLSDRACDQLRVIADRLDIVVPE